MTTAKGGRLHGLNEKFANSFLGRYFQVTERKTTLFQEIRAGTVTFLTLAYILSVNANILASSGGPCTPDDCTGPLKGQYACRFPNVNDPGWNACLDETRKNLIVATAGSGCLASLVTGIAANFPVGLAPGMGLNAYFTYNVVGFMGTGNVSYKEALAAIFIEGWIFIILSVTGVRQGLVRLLPRTLSLAMSAGIGLFLAFIGFQGSEGVGLVGGDGATLVTLGGCSPENQIHPFYIQDSDMAAICSPPPGQTAPFLPPPGDNYECLHHKVEAGTLWLGLAGLAIMTILMARGFKGAIIVGIVVTTIIAWIPGSSVSYLGSTSPIINSGIGGTGEARWEYFRNVVAVPSLRRTGAALDFTGLKNGSLWIALVTFLYVDFFDATGTLFAMANFVNTFLPGFVDEKTGNFPRSVLTYCSDGLGIIIGALMGSSPVTVFVESATGIREGGRTGITAITIAIYYFIALWFTPILASIPTYCTGPALILTGSLMMVNAARIDWQDMNKAIPAFITIAVMPFTYSISYGVIGGVGAYIITHGVKFLWDKADELMCGRRRKELPDDSASYKEGQVPAADNGGVDNVHDVHAIK